MIEYIQNFIKKRFENDSNVYFSDQYIYTLYKKIKSENYNITDIFDSLNVLNVELYINETKVESKEKFGEILRIIRKNNNITRLDLLTEKDISFTITNKVESGKNCKKENLKKYLDCFPNIKFELKINQFYETVN